jgi:hypothetical protein
MTWSQANHDHLIFAMGEIESLAFEANREKDAGKRRQLAEVLRGKLETAREIQIVAQNAARYVAEKIASLEDL